MIAVGLSLTLTIGIGGLQIYNSHKQLENAIKEINRLEQNVKTQNSSIKKLQIEKIKVQDEYNKSIKDNNSLKLQNQNLQNEVQDLKDNYINVTASAYIAKCKEGCSGRTLTGLDVTNTVYYDGRRVVATDPNVIPMFSKLELHFENGAIMKAIAVDTGGAIKGNKLDLLVGSEGQALNFGRQKVTVHLIRE
jgi:3D (Asp-Asp-Asp) domain-containing protein